MTKKFWRCLLGIACACLSVNIANAASFEAEAYWQEGLSHKKNGNMKEAFASLETAAGMGHTKASLELAKMFLTSSTAQDMKKAEQYLKPLADENNGNAWYYLGELYRKQNKFDSSLACYRNALAAGSAEDPRPIIGTMLINTRAARNIEEGMQILKEGAEAGNARCMYDLAYEIAFNGHADRYEEAVFWAEKAANDLKEANYILGAVYEYGLGHPIDIREAVKYYEASKSGAGFYKAANLLELHLDGHKADELYKESAQQGNIYAKAAYGRFLVQRGNNSGYGYLQEAVQSGDGVAFLEYGKAYDVLGKNRLLPKNPREAQSWYEKAAAQNNREAEIRLGLLAWKGKHRELAYSWFEKRAAEGSEAQLRLAEGYRQPRRKMGVLEAALFPRDNDRAGMWYRRAAEGGNKEAQFYLGLYAIKYAKDKKPSVPFEHAAHWLQLASVQGHAPAQTLLGQLYENGAGGVSAHLPTAYALYFLAAKSGYMDAKDALSRLEASQPGLKEQGGLEAVAWERKYPAIVDKYPQYHIYCDKYGNDIPKAKF